MDVAREHAGQLDSLRAFAVVAVIFSHTIEENYAIGDFQFFEFGSYGVYLFFVLSAYLITSQLLKGETERRRSGSSLGDNLKRFYVKRALRLFPAYFLALAGGAIVALPGIREEFLWHAAQLSTVLFGFDQIAESTSTAGHFWSLSVEWLFYLVWPVTIYLALGRYLVAVMAALLMVAVLSWAPWDVLHMPAALDQMNIAQSLDSLMFGALLAYAQFRRVPLSWLPRAGWAAAAVALAGLAPFMLGNKPLGEDLLVVTHESMNLSFCALVYAATVPVKGAAGWVLDRKLLQYTGKISYGMYVYHGFVLAFYLKVTEYFWWPSIPWGIWMTIALTIASFLTAAISWEVMERPINAYRRRFQTPAQAAAAAA